MPSAPAVAQQRASRVGPVVDCNAHLWDQRGNPVLAAQFPDLNIVIDHFGWPEVGPSRADLAGHMDRMAGLAASGNVATRIDAIGTIFGDWTPALIRPWLLGVADIFGPQRCMLGSDLPIENLRSGFGPLYAAYDAIFSAFSDDDRAWLFHRTAERWYASASAVDLE